MAVTSVESSNPILPIMPIPGKPDFNKILRGIAMQGLLNQIKESEAEEKKTHAKILKMIEEQS